jgi:hypothetical protein
MRIGLRIKCPLLSTHFNENNFLGKILKNTQISNFIEILPVDAELFYADRRTDGQT